MCSRYPRRHFDEYNCDRYLGAFENGKMHGQGTKSKVDGSIIFAGLWKNGRPSKVSYIWNPHMRVVTLKLAFVLSRSLRQFRRYV